MSVRDTYADVSTATRRVSQRMRIVGGCHKRCKSRTILLGATKDRATVHLAYRQRLLQLGVLLNTDGLELIQIHEEIIRQSHLLVELVAQVQMVHIKLSQLQGQQSTHKGGLTTTLITNKRRHTFIAMKHIHQLPMSHSRTKPDGEIVQLFRGDTRYASK